MADPIVEQLAAQALGAAPQQAGQPPAPAAPAAPEDAAVAPTQGEAAQALVAPKSEGDMSEEQSVLYNIKFGDKERQLTPEQIASTFDRYGKLNHKWQSEVAPLEPVIQLAKAIMAEAQKSGQNIDPAALAEYMKESLTMRSSSFGKQGNQQQAQPQPQGEDEFTKWEEENAVQLPPGFRESTTRIQSLEAQLQQTQQMLMQVLQAQQGVAQAAQGAAQSAQGDHLAAIQQTISNNLNQAQQYYQLPDEAEQDFMTFASSRGYTIEDFVDPQLTMAVVGDFKANMNTPEMERLKAIAQRRQAYTGSAVSAPGAAGADPATPPDPIFDRLATAAVNKRMGNA